MDCDCGGLHAAPVGCIIVHRRKYASQKMHNLATSGRDQCAAEEAAGETGALAPVLDAIGMVIDTSLFKGKPWVTVSLHPTGETVSRRVVDGDYRYGDKVVVANPAVRRDSTPTVLRKVA
jgi:hypothetical protein